MKHYKINECGNCNKKLLKTCINLTHAACKKIEEQTFIIEACSAECLQCGMYYEDLKVLGNNSYFGRYTDTKIQMDRASKGLSNVK